MEAHVVVVALLAVTHLHLQQTVAHTLRLQIILIRIEIPAHPTIVTPRIAMVQDHAVAIVPVDHVEASAADRTEAVAAVADADDKS